MAAETDLVTGGTGAVGRALVAELVARPDVRVQVLTATAGPSPPPALRCTSATSATRAACARPRPPEPGCSCSPAARRSHGTTPPWRGPAAHTGVMQLVKLSALGVGRGGRDPITRCHRAGEFAVRASGVAWTVLRPTGFTSNALGWAYSIAATDTVAARFPTGRTAPH